LDGYKSDEEEEEEEEEGEEGQKRQAAYVDRGVHASDGGRCHPSFRGEI